MIFNEEVFLSAVNSGNYNEILKISLESELKYIETATFKNLMLKSCIISIVNYFKTSDNKKQNHLLIFLFLFGFKNCLGVKIDLTNFKTRYNSYKHLVTTNFYSLSIPEYISNNSIKIKLSSIFQNLLLLTILYDFELMHFNKTTKQSNYYDYNSIIIKFISPKNIENKDVQFLINFLLEQKSNIDETELNTIQCYENLNPEIINYTFLLYFKKSVNYKFTTYSDPLSYFLYNTDVKITIFLTPIAIIEKWISWNDPTHL